MKNKTNKPSIYWKKTAILVNGTWRLDIQMYKNKITSISHIPKKVYLSLIYQKIMSISFSYTKK